MPQILKEEIKEKILSSALNSFLEKGYRSTSMQEIAQKAGITAGNIYNYFHNKEEVFSTLIGPVLAEVKKIFGVRAADIARLKTEDRIGISETKMQAFIKVYQSRREVFLLLFEKSDNTKFETTKAEVIESLSLAIRHAKNSVSANPATKEQEMLIRAFATAYVNGVISILVEKTDETSKLNALQEFLPFMRSKLADSMC